MSKDEIGDLGLAVNRMAGGLERRELVERTFRRYVDKQIVDRILSGDQQTPHIAGQRMQAVVLFADIRGFTTLSETLAPEKVVALLNLCFEELCGVITAHGGVIDKFIGDSILAVWGVPNVIADAEACAVRAALAMQAAAEVMNAGLAARGEPTLGIGIGLNAGIVVAGSLGSRDRMEYTVVGDVVNTAQRVESQARPGQVLVPASVLAPLEGRVELLGHEDRQLKGKTGPTRIFSVKAMAPAKAA
jgi:adenylate cyclase